MSGAEPCFFLVYDGWVELLEQGLSVGQGSPCGGHLNTPAGRLKRALIAQVSMERLAGEGQIRREGDVESADGAEGGIEDSGATPAVAGDELPRSVLFDVAVGFACNRHGGLEAGPEA